MLKLFGRFAAWTIVCAITSGATAGGSPEEVKLSSGSLPVTQPSPTPPDASAIKPNPPPVVDPSVCQVVAVRPPEGGFGSPFTVVIRGIPLPPPADRDGILAPMKSWLLHLDGQPVVNFVPSNVHFEVPVEEASASHAAGSMTGPLVAFKFDLAYSLEAKAAWRYLFSMLGASEPHRLSVGPAGGPGVPLGPTAQSVYRFSLVPTIPFAVTITGWFLLSIAVLLAARRWDFLASPGSPISKAGPRTGKRAYSLGLVQAAVWFLVILGVWLALGIITGVWMGSLTGTALGLLGISAATAVGSAAISYDKQQQDLQAKKQADTAAGQLSVLDDAIAAQKSLPQNGNAHALSTLTGQRQAVAAQLAAAQVANAMPTQANQDSRGFFRDIFYDGDSPALHRMQVVVWTAVIVAVFVYRVIHELQMPELDPTLLGLMGISAGTYLGLKVPGQK